MFRSLSVFAAVTLLSLAAASVARAQDAGIYVLRFIETAADVRKDVPALLQKLAEDSRQEAGLVRFEILQRTQPANQFVIAEAWKDKQALDAHTAAAHTKDFLAKLQPLLIAPVDERFCDPLAVTPPAEGRVPRGRRYVITHIDVNPPNKDNAFSLLKDMAAASRKDAGNIRFDVTVQQVRNQNHFEVIEVWRTQKAKDAHDAAANTKEFRGKLAPLSGARYDQRFYRPL